MEVKNLCKAYGDLPVLENVSFTVGVGVTALWGPSGVGKTTLLRILLGLEKPDSGELMGNGRPLERRFSGGPPVRGTGRLGKSPVCAGDGLRGSESGGHAHGAGPDLGDGQAGARVVRRHEAPLGFGRALLAVSDAVALDEPFTGLDEENRRRAVLCVTAAAETKPVILVTHDRTELNLLRANIVNL